MKKFLSMVLALVMAMSLVTISAGAKDFTDDSKVNYAEAVDVISALGIVDGYTDGSFRPTTELNRAQAAKIICNMILGPTTASALSASAAPFSDVPADHWAAGYIAYCAKEGIIAGMGDGSFHPADTLTGYAFMKMLLTAIGYDAEMESFVGANWGVNVAKQAIGIGLDDGNDEFVGTAKVTREEACLYAFNALTATMVKYGSKTTVNVNGATVVVGGSEATEVDGKGYKDYKGEKENETLEFCEKYFPNLRLTENQTDDFGRPANTWKIKSKEVGKYATTPALTYTAEVDGDEVYDDLGEPTMKKDGKTTKYLIDGKEQDNVTLDSSKTSFGGNGTLTEVYTKENDNDVAVTVVVINTYVAEIDSVTEAKGDDDRYVTVDSAMSKLNPDFETEEFEEDDVVLFTVAYDKDADEGKGEYAIKSMELAEIVEDVKVSKVNLSKEKFEAEGTTYEINATFDKTTMPDYDKSYDLYLDQNGYVVMVDEVEADTEYAVLFAVKGVDEDSMDQGAEFEARLVMMDATKTSYVDASWAKNKAPAKIEDAIGKLVVYTYDEDEDTYELELADAEDLKSAVITKGKSAVVDGEDKIYTNSKTIFLVGDVDDNGKWSFESYTGFKTVPSMKDVVGQYVTDGAVEVVFVSSSAADSKSKDLTFIFTESGVKYEQKDTFYEFNAVADGEITTIRVEATENNLIDYEAEEGYVVLSSTSTNSRDVVTDVELAQAGKDKDYTVGTVEKKFSDDILTIKRDGESKAVGFGVADDCVFFRVDEDGEVVKSTASGMKAGSTVLFTVDEDDGVIDLCICFVD